MNADDEPPNGLDDDTRRWLLRLARGTIEVALAGEGDDIPVRAFENAVYYVFANSVGPQGGGKWSAGDSKIVAPDGSCLRLANNRREQVLVQDLDLSRATRKYALDSLQHPSFLANHWRRLLPELRRRVRETDLKFQRWFQSAGSASVA